MNLPSPTSTPLPNVAANGGGPGLRVPDALPHGIKGLVTYERSIPPWLAVLLVVVGGAACLALLYYLWRQYQARLARRPGEHPLLGLRRQLEALQVPEAFARSEQVEYFYELGFLFRQIIEQACSFPATDLTLKELKLPLRSYLPFPHSEVEAVVHFFERTDLIKFAEATTSREEAHAAHRQLCGWAETLVRKALLEASQAELAPSSQQLRSQK